MFGVRLKTLKTQETDHTEDFTTHLAPQASPGHQALGSTLTSKLVGGDDLGEMTFTPDLDFRLMVDVGLGFGDSLGDASMDCFTDLTSMLMGPNFLEQAEENKEEDEEHSGEPLAFLSLEPAVMKSQQTFPTQQHPSFTSEIGLEDPPSDLAKLSANVGLKRSRTPSLDHDYTPKRARLSPPSVFPRPEDTAEDPFLVPEAVASPASSRSGPDVAASSEDEHLKRKQRRQKNNLASKRSREIRKRKFVNMESEAEKLTEENARLERRVVELEKLAKRMRETLVTKLKIQT